MFLTRTVTQKRDGAVWGHLQSKRGGHLHTNWTIPSLRSISPSIIQRAIHFKGRMKEIKRAVCNNACMWHTNSSAGLCGSAWPLCWVTTPRHSLPRSAPGAGCVRQIELVLKAMTLCYCADVSALSCLSEAGLNCLENLLQKSVSVLLGHLVESRNGEFLRIE